MGEDPLLRERAGGNGATYLVVLCSLARFLSCTTTSARTRCALGRLGHLALDLGQADNEHASFLVLLAEVPTTKSDYSGIVGSRSLGFFSVVPKIMYHFIRVFLNCGSKMKMKKNNRNTRQILNEFFF